jgi:hypothetical protein
MESAATYLRQLDVKSLLALLRCVNGIGLADIQELRITNYKLYFSTWGSLFATLFYFQDYSALTTKSK